MCLFTLIVKPITLTINRLAISGAAVIHKNSIYRQPRVPETSHIHSMLIPREEVNAHLLSANPTQRAPCGTEIAQLKQTAQGNSYAAPLPCYFLFYLFIIYFAVGMLHGETFLPQLWLPGSPALPARRFPALALMEKCRQRRLCTFSEQSHALFTAPS